MSRLKPGKTWRTIKRDPALNSPEAFFAALAEKKCSVSDWARDIIGKPAFKKSLDESEQEHDLYILTTAQLTGKKDETSTTDEVFAGIKQLGFQICPAWVGPQLRLDYKNQPKGEWIHVAMELIRDSVGSLSVFNVKHGDSGLWLFADCASPSGKWCPDSHWVVCRPRK